MLPVKKKKPDDMKILKILSSLIVAGILFISCTIEPQAINYGHDACSFCQMTIVDNQHAAELVTHKGKVYKFDSIECMMRDINKHGENNIALYLINDYSNPGKLIDAKSATYLISENLPSPMGANLTGFGNKKDAEIVQREKDGDLYSWNELKGKF